MSRKNINSVKLSFLFILTSLSFSLSAYEWPQPVSETTTFAAYFGQPRGSSFVNSLVFSDEDKVQASEDGELLLTMDSSLSEYGWFPSTLGNAVILTHKNDILTVYANLEETDIPNAETEEETYEIKAGTEIGKSGASGWQQGKTSLEFQVIDTRLQTILNPFILLPAKKQKHTPYIQDLSLYNRSGIKQRVVSGSKINAGIYSLYINPQPYIMSYKTTVMVNGAETETITCNILKQENNRLCFSGKRNYSFREIFPDKQRQYLAEVNFSKGRNTVSISVSDIFGNERTSTYIIDVQ